MKITTIMLILTLLICGFTLAAAAGERMVKVIYFVPNDRPFQWDIPSALDTQMKKVQTFYADQMEAHGYGRKTFKLETNANGKVVVHPVTGQHGDMHYHTDTLNKIISEIGNRFDIEKDIYVFVVDVSTELIDGNCGIGRYEGGPAVVPATGECVQDDEGYILIAHELGHTFNLVHDFRNDLYIMSYGSGRNQLSDCAAEALNVSLFFDQGDINRPATNAHAVIEMLTPWTYPAGDENWKIRFSVSDPNGIYQVQFEHAAAKDGSSLADCQNFDNVQDITVEFTLPTDATAAEINNIWIRVFDQNGNVTTKGWTLEAAEGPETTETFTYLTLSYEDPDALVPTNTSAQWDGWLGHIWEKTPDGQVAEKPQFYITHPYVNVWGHWFYAHAESRIVYDISGKDYTRFECLFYLANPCTHAPPGASMEVICLADDTEIYNSGVLSGNAEKRKNRHHISFDIPMETQTLAILITDGPNDNSCDHFVIGNPRLFHSDISDIETIDTETETIDTDRTETYLTLTYDSPDALVPINPSAEWRGWPEGVWEKTPDGHYRPKPKGFVYSSYIEVWDHWFYAHAHSRIDYDLRGGNYIKFDASFTMPNPCGNIASVEFICLADNIEIYNSGLLIGAVTQNKHISFDIPINTKMLTIRVTDGGIDDGCDHYILGNPRLLHGDPSTVVDDYNYTDVNGDGLVNIIDLVLVASRYGEKVIGDPFPNPDINRDGIVDIKDIILIAEKMSSVAGASTLLAMQCSILTSTDWREAYAALPDKVVDKGIVVLNLLFGSAAPTKTVLLENYPNPFNPETWIPYQLAKPVDVAITIRAVDGQIVRRLNMGHQNAGSYIRHSRAAYWDGKNTLGESVTSGLYFYTLTAGKFAATRRMLIRK